MPLFTSFSGHRLAQRECARTGLRSHARCHPYHRGLRHLLFSNGDLVMWVLLRPTRTN